MTDPISLVALGAAVGGVAGKFVEKAWDAGERWLNTYFRDHQEKAQEQAKINSADFLNDLAKRIKKLEKQEEVSKAKIETAQDHPDFSVTLQKALLSAAQTGSRDKHELLARLVTERLKANSESLLSLASKMACDAISYTTQTQLNILGLQVNLEYLNPSAQALSEDQYQKWLLDRLGFYSDLKFNYLDLYHLEALSCLKFQPMVSRDLSEFFSKKNKGVFNGGAFYKTTIGKKIEDLWMKGLGSITLTSVGQVIGVYVSDLNANTSTRFDEKWY